MSYFAKIRKEGAKAHKAIVLVLANLCAFFVNLCVMFLMSEKYKFLRTYAIDFTLLCIVHLNKKHHVAI
ncbi:hypothetical protein Q766_00255 [Flavobacterium subsaxonicum WB 4.1-42 = DSM 21790]|uniref:Uncharacterized protein n=1 Tax=Flavobacterium subsaxonicum WB 4.1-42 = DSM 21790 TaxID=1121898 RepID=A0A0A2MPJ3_9FLAO|nr:hypothetical protein Q766_00255 [Flavobacterium subsaxonicum WB 4.1-42 = DSM 21790]